FFQAEDGIRDRNVTGVQTCALPIWAWAGFTTHDRNRCQVMARITALIYNWWTIYMRLGIPGKHAEAITSRPLALHGIARRTRHRSEERRVGKECRSRWARYV